MQFSKKFLVSTVSIALIFSQTGFITVNHESNQGLHIQKQSETIFAKTKSKSKKKVKFPSKYSQFKDGRFNTYNLDASLSYKRNIKLWTKDIVDDVIIRTNVSFEKAAKTRDTIAYRNASNPSLRNQVVLRRDGMRPMIYPMKLNYEAQTEFNIGLLFNTKKLNSEMIKLVNQERKRNGIRPLYYSSRVYEGALLRSNELASYGHININGKAHVRPNHERFNTAFDQIPNALYKVGENTAMNYYQGNPYELVSEKYMAEKFFKQWKASPGHYKNMMRPDYKYMAVSIKANHFNNIELGRYTYFFGVQGFSRPY
ncbi:CAP domain-containing protein [Macrococcoides caseolyticum]|uniref:CAP domain-containing protein n=1 Tax=Macrococcoides caseolyticum TaxID=69966 RepID=UPI001F1BDAA4|nr:CAP domain-containing protein [Macrococcus caseolyticus]MCE4956135.1 CAP domain-containing protein [Macrococcus caseolyticus]